MEEEDRGGTTTSSSGSGSRGSSITRRYHGVHALALQTAGAGVGAAPNDDWYELPPEAQLPPKADNG